MAIDLSDRIYPDCKWQFRDFQLREFSCIFLSMLNVSLQGNSPTQLHSHEFCQMQPSYIIACLICNVISVKSQFKVKNNEKNYHNLCSNWGMFVMIGVTSNALYEWLTLIFVEIKHNLLCQITVIDSWKEDESFVFVFVDLKIVNLWNFFNFQLKRCSYQCYITQDITSYLS